MILKESMTNRKSNINVDKIVKHWIETSDDDFKTSLSLFESKSYSWSLFVGHISTEKILKALYVKKFSKHAPFIHNKGMD
ncbi:MAG: HEPN domain-containing protein [Prolixibacteraceae bacterium]|nr:HEPN domain-containing protein [Prolixibacteraceae bacterium]MBN2649063.1 HEPN domain-containing protein [Prolixibacteraceae bacterium]